MDIEVRNNVIITEPSPELYEWLRDKLEVANPDYSKKKRMGFYVGNTPRTISLYQTNGNKIIVPYGMIGQIPQELLPDVASRNIKRHPALKDVRIYKDSSSDMPLYDYQRRAMTETMMRFCGIVNAPAGSGKTEIGVALTREVGVKTLWLTHTKDLLNQTKERFEKYIDKDLIGTITEGKVDIGSWVTIATVQTISKIDLTQWQTEWGMVIVDECHRVAGSPTTLTMFYKVIDSLIAMRKYGLSATIHRADGMTQSMFALLGGVVSEITQEDVGEKIMKVGIATKFTGTSLDYSCYGTDGMLNYQKMISYLANDTERNDLIISIAEKEADNGVIVLSERVAHLKQLLGMLDKNDTVLITGETAADERVKAINDLKAGRKNILLATYQLVKEGLDIPRMSRLILATPQKDYAVITQSIGRIARTSEGKEDAICYDLVDKNQYLFKSYKARCTTYRKNNCYFRGEDEIG